MPDQIGRATIQVDYGQYYLVPIEAEYDFDALASSSSTNGVTVAADVAVAIWSGTHTGRIDLEIQVLERPPVVNLDDWDAVVETNLDSTTAGGFEVELWGGGPPPKGLPSLASPPGYYRLRIHCRGRDREQVKSREVHLLCVWPAPPEADTILKTDELATEMMKPKLAATRPKNTAGLLPKGVHIIHGNGGSRIIK